ncbi:hypothetical protein PSQ40_09605 [Curvibacter sp. HBC61]|uniref:Uncharacterized protein n=1 Tax=Curvibacter cyanobacteriorum TaxID=3026422 RepID=A0ABT5MZS5_9BURK|nr:hypothetical protein [Curvibacter sp. HBC61]MDD0838824.1 hypothetical protein [Curvibacter sp. HBC61]
MTFQNFPLSPRGALWLSVGAAVSARTGVSALDGMNLSTMMISTMTTAAP